MLDLLQPLARAILFAVDELADGIERRRGKMARLRLVGEFIGAELTDESGKRPGDFIGVFVAIARIFPFGSGEGLIGHPVLRELLPHVRHVRGEVNVASVLAAIDVRARAAVGFSAGTALEPILAAVARDGAAVGESQRFLKRHIDALAGAGFARVANAGKPQHRRHRAGHLIREMARRRALPFGVVALAKQKPAGGVGDGITAFVMAIGPGAAERRQRNDNQAWKFLFETRVVETEFLQITERRRFDK